MSSSGAWGAGSWGSGSWGGGVSSVLTVLGAIAVRENVVRVIFSQPVYFSKILDPFDASNPTHFTVTPVDGTTDQLSQPTRDVTVVAVERPDINSSPPIETADVGAHLDLILDRPMSSYPSAYTVTCIGIKNAKLTSTIGSASFDFDGVYRDLSVPDLETAAPLRDLASPQTLSALQEASPDDLTVIATYVVGEDGDYAFDQGATGRKKRIIRRVFTKKGGFVHLPNYGVSITSYGKKLARLDTIGKLTTEARIQISREPDVAKVVVNADIRRATPDLLRLHIAIKPHSARSQKFTVSVPIT